MGNIRAGLGAVLCPGCHGIKARNGDFVGSFQVRLDVVAGGQSASTNFDVDVPADAHAAALQQYLEEGVDALIAQESF